MYQFKIWRISFIKRFTRCFLFLLLFVLITIPLLITSNQLAKKRVIADSTQKLEYGLDLFGSQIQNARDIMQYLLDDSNYADLLLLEGDPQVKHYMKMNTIQKQVNNYLATQEMFLGGYIVFEKNQLFISSEYSSNTLFSIYPQFFSYQDIPLEEWYQSLFSGPFDSTFLPYKSSRFYHQTYDNSLTYILNTTYYTSIDNSSVMGFIFDRDKILQAMMKDNVIESGFLRLSDSNGSTLMNYQISDEIILPSGMETVEIDGIRYQIISQYSEKADIRVTIGIPYGILREDYDPLVTLAKVYCFVGLILITIFSIIFAYRDVKEVNGVLTTISQISNTTPDSSNEYAFIKKAFQIMGNENQTQLLRIQQLGRQVNDQMLHRLLLDGFLSRREEEGAIALFGNRFDRFLVVKCKFLLETEVDIGQERLYLFNRVLEQNIAVPYESLLTAPDEITFLLFLLQEEMPMLEDSLEKVVLQISETSFPVYMGISQILSGVRQIHTAYLQAQYALNFRPAESSRLSIYQSSTHNALFALDPSIFTKLYRVIISGEKEQLDDVFRSIRETPVWRQNQKAEQIQLAFSVRQAIVNAYTEILREEDHDIWKLLALEPNLLELPEKMLARFYEASQQLCSQVIARRKSGNHLLRDQILSYIQEHFSNVGLCAAVIAEEFSIAEKYVYLFMKEQTGQTLGMVIENIRLNEAEKLLRNTTYSNKTISEMTGFGSENTFYRAFAKRHGISPAAWRKQEK